MVEVLLVEDDLDLASTVMDYFDIKGFSCDHAIHGQAALNLARESSYGVIVLDINLPKINGFDVCRTLRDQGADTPILMLTSKSSLEDKLEGFDSGADDYLVKPFAMQELAARIKALSGRRSGQAKHKQFGALTVDSSGKSASVQGEVLKLSPTEFSILECLVAHAPDSVSREHIQQMLWSGELPETDCLKVHIYKIRKELARLGLGDMLQTIKGFGFALRAGNED